MKLPQTWLDALKALQAGGFPEAVIAGGALRDLDNGRGDYIKDVDIFIKHRGSDTFAAVALDLRETQHAVTMMTPESVCEYLENLADVKAIFNAWPAVASTGDALSDILSLGHYADAPLQIIALENWQGPQHVLSRIDLGLCQIGHDGRDVFVTQEYERDKGSRTMTVVRCESTGQFERTRKRFVRLSAKYSGYEFSVPLRFQQYGAATVL